MLQLTSIAQKFVNYLRNQNDIIYTDRDIIWFASRESRQSIISFFPEIFRYKLTQRNTYLMCFNEDFLITHHDRWKSP